MQFKVHFKEKIYFILMSALSILMYGTLCSIQISIVVGYVVLFVLFRLFLPIFFIGLLKGNGIKLHEKQLPEIFELVKQHAQALDLPKIPEVYLLQGNGILNAFATRFAGRNFVILHSDILEVAFKEGKDAVSFIIGHELGHIKRGHVGFLKSILIWPASFIPFMSLAYSRACEYTCDNIGYNLCPQGAAKGALILAAGKKLYTKVNIDALILTMKQEAGFAVWFAEIFSTHPALIKRIAVFNQLNRENPLMPEDSFFISPKFDGKSGQAQQ